MERLKRETQKFEQQKDDLDQCFANLNSILGNSANASQSYAASGPSQSVNAYSAAVDPYTAAASDPYAAAAGPESSLLPDYAKLYAQPPSTDMNKVDDIIS